MLEVLVLSCGTPSMYVVTPGFAGLEPMPRKRALLILRALRSEKYVLGEYTPAFYELRAQLFAAATRAALAAFEATLKARMAEVSEQECRKLRLILARRWKVVK